MQWISQNRELISALTGLGTLLIWLVYLQIFIINYRRKVRATLLVAQGPGDGLDARCLLSNMSVGPVYVQSVIVKVETITRTFTCPVTNRAIGERALQTRQGPLASGETRDIGSFASLIAPGLRTAAKVSDGEADQIKMVRSMMIEVLGVYGPEDLPIGARRRFAVLAAGGCPRIQGAEIETEQIRSRRERRRLIGDLKRDR